MLNSLRPENFKEFIGQNKLKDTLKVLIESASIRKKQVDHLLFYGQPGIGKTSLAQVIANEMSSSIRFVQGSLLDKKADILPLFGSLKKGEVIFIDEIHSISKNVEELLYTALEDQALDIIIGPEGNSKVVRMKLPNFTLIGATTKSSKISLPLKERFGLIGKLTPYEKDEMIKIIKNSAKILKIKVSQESLEYIADHSKQTPRIANNLLKRCFDFATVKNLKEINLDIVKDTFENIGLFKHGLTEQHIQYLKVLNDTFMDKWASLDAIAGIILETKETIESDIEPILLSLGMLEKSSRGRKITNEGIKYMFTYNLV